MERRKWFVIRVDGGLEIGSGHIMRCLSLAQGLKERGMSGCFLTANIPISLAGMIEKAGFEIVRLEASLDDNAGSRLAYAHSEWLAHSEVVDAQLSLDKIRSQIKLRGVRPEIVVVDHYALASRWESIVGEVSPILAIDDLNDRKHCASWLLDQTLGKSRESYRGLIGPDTRTLLGCHYSLLRGEFAQLRAEAISRRAEFSKVERILVTLGGVDKDNVAEVVLSALARSSMMSNVFVDVVVGASNPHIGALRESLGDLPFNCSLEVQVNDMASRMLSADLCIGAAGSTSWERCVLGLPAINVVLADNQKYISEVLSRHGAAVDFGRIDGASVSGLAGCVESLCEDDEMYRKMSKLAFALCDGAGVDRVLAEVLDGH